MVCVGYGDLTAVGWYTGRVCDEMVPVQAHVSLRCGSRTDTGNCWFYETGLLSRFRRVLAGADAYLGWLTFGQNQHFADGQPPDLDAQTAVWDPGR